MALIEERKNKYGISYRITVSYGYDKNGKQIRKCTSYVPDTKLTPAKKKKAVERFAMEFEKKVLSGEYETNRKIKLSDYCEQWLKTQKDILSPTTYNFYKSFIDDKLVKKLGSLKLDEIKKKHIETFLNEMKYRENGKEYSQNSQKKYLAIVKSIFHTAWLDEIIEKNPTERIHFNRNTDLDYDSNKVKCFSLEETMTFLNILENGITYHYNERKRKDRNGNIYSIKSYTSTHNIPTQFKVFFNIAIFGGLRKGEILALTWNDIDFQNNTISIHKSVCYTKGQIIIKKPKTQKSNRTITLPSSVINIINIYYKEWEQLKETLGPDWKGSDYLFIQSDGSLMHPSTPYHKFKEIIHQYNATCQKESDKLPLITLHDLRHTSATLLISQNIDIAVVSERLGHSNISTTLDIYTHALKKADESASNKLENIFFPKINAE